jgi:hypothetical protein
MAERHPVRHVVLALGAGHLGDLGGHELAHDLQADGHRRRQEALSHSTGEEEHLVARLARQALGERDGELWVVEIDQANAWQDRQSRLAGALRGGCGLVRDVRR